VRLGILGGTFNPPHLGHLVCAQEAYVQLGLERVLLTPTHVPPHKELPDDPGPGHRLALCELAVRGDDRFGVCELELQRDGPSYTVDTLEKLHATVHDSELYLIVGGDIAAGLPEWRKPERVLSLATLAVASRPGTTQAAVEAALSRLQASGKARFFDMPQLAVSSTLVRERVQSGQPIRYLVPEQVARYIERHDLYASAPAGATRASVVS
jgi:nicotinate-nucleotide adenylyltransferase